MGTTPSGKQDANISVVFPHLPHNTSRIYHTAYCHNGCEVYIPATTHEEGKKLKIAIQEFLDNQIMPEKTIA